MKNVQVILSKRFDDGRAAYDYVLDIVECADPKVIVRVMKTWGYDGKNRLPDGITLKACTVEDLHYNDFSEVGNQVHLVVATPKGKRVSRVCAVTEVGPIDFVEWCNSVAI